MKNAAESNYDLELARDPVHRKNLQNRSSTIFEWKLNLSQLTGRESVLGPLETKVPRAYGARVFSALLPLPAHWLGPMLTVFGLYFCNRAAQSTAIPPLATGVFCVALPP